MRTNEYLTAYSGNDISGWSVDGSSISTSGVSVSKYSSVEVVYRPDLDNFEDGKLYYLSISAYDGIQFTSISDSYTFKARDISSLIYCGEYVDIPVVKNFALMIEITGKFHCFNIGTN